MKPLLGNHEGMNNTEARYASQLELMKQSGQIKAWRFGRMNFKLVERPDIKRIFYKPDFLVVHADHFEIIEVKGQVREDDVLKFKMAADQWPWFRWKMVKLEKTGVWTVLYSY